MRFSSNAEMAQHYFREFMSDGGEHTLKEAISYVLEQTGGKGVRSEDLRALRLTRQYSTLLEKAARILTPAEAVIKWQGKTRRKTRRGSSIVSPFMISWQAQSANL